MKQNDESQEKKDSNKKQLFYGWKIVAASFLICLIAYGIQYSFGVFFKPIQQEFSWSRALVSGIVSVYWIGHGAFSILMGWLADKYGPRWIVTAAGSIAGLALLLVGHVQAAWQLYLFYGVIFSLGISAIWTVLISVVSRWFVQKRGMALGLIAAGTGTGTVVMPILSRYLISAYDWRTTYTIWGVVIWLFIITVATFLRRDPESMGLKPYGWEPEKPSSAGRVMVITFGAAIRQRALWVLAAMHLFTSVGLQMLMTHVVNYATDVGVAPMMAASFVSFIGGFGIAGRILVGGASDRIGARRAFVICALANMVAMFWLTQITSSWAFYLFGVFFGFFYGGWIPMFPALAAELFGTSHLATIYGIVTLASGVGGVIGPFMAGYLFDLTNSYMLAFSLGAAAMFLAAVSSLLLKRRGPAITNPHNP